MRVPETKQIPGMEWREKFSSILFVDFLSLRKHGFSSTVAVGLLLSVPISTSSRLIGRWFSSSSSFAVCLQESNYTYLTTGPSFVVSLNRNTTTISGSHEFVGLLTTNLFFAFVLLNLPVKSILSLITSSSPQERVRVSESRLQASQRDGRSNS